MHSLRLKNDLMRVAASEVENLNAYAKPGRKIFDRVTKILNNKTTYTISRQIIAGSMGKKTSLGYDLEPDFDVVMFVYDKISSLKPVVDQFYDILLNNLPQQCDDWFRFDASTLTKNPFGLMFAVETVIELPSESRKVTINFDVLPAFHFSSDIDEHTEMVLEKIKMSGKPDSEWIIYSTSLCEKTVQFVREQPALVHYVIRLAKKWDRELKNRVEESGGNPYISGRSSIIELIAIKAALEEGTNILEAFRRFLQLIKDIDNIYFNFFDSVTRPRPLILDAVNPFNNYAKPIKPIHKVYFHLRAEKTLIALGQAEDGRDYEGKFAEFLNFFS